MNSALKKPTATKEKTGGVHFENNEAEQEFGE